MPFDATRGNLIQSSDDGYVTPGRVSTLTLDRTETVLLEDGLNQRRSGLEIAHRAAEGAADDDEHSGLRHWATGAWSLAPVQDDLANLYESTAGVGLIVPAAQMNFVQIRDALGVTANAFLEFNSFRTSDYTGVRYSASVPATGDPFLRRFLPSGGSVDPASLSVNTGFDGAVPLIPYLNSDVAMDRLIVSKQVYRADQGFCLRWEVPGTLTSYPRYVFSFLFSQYGLVIRGDGRAELWERCHTSGGTNRWVRRFGPHTFRFAPEGMAPTTAHAMGIMPQRGYNGERYIVFTNLSNGTAPRANTSGHNPTAPGTVGEVVYRVDETVRGSDRDESPGHVTSANNFRVEVRCDLMLKLQISRLGFGTAGTLIDDDSIVGGGAFTSNTAPVALTLQAAPAAGCSVTGIVQDGQTGGTFTPGTSLFPQAKFTFSGSGSDTPLLWGYTMRQPQAVGTSAPGSFAIAPRSYSIAGYAGDPQEESASVVLFDLTGQHSRLRKRGMFSALLTSTYTPRGGSQVTVRLFQGHVRRPRSVQVTPPSGVGSSPDVAGRRYDLTLTGMYGRLAEKVEPPVIRVFAVDAAAPPDPDTGAQPPWKVTDVVRALIGMAGFPASQINIPDLPFRLWAGFSQSVDDLSIQPGADFAEMCVRLLREYLGCYLHFEPNAGADGQWTLLFATVPLAGGGFTPVWNFVSGPPAGHAMPVTHPQAYPDATTFIGESPDFVTVPADFTQIVVSADQPTTTADTRLQSVAYAYNFAAYPVPGSTVTPDPDGFDYFGRLLRFTYLAPQLAGFTYEDTARAVRWTCRRFYNFLCHPQRLCTFRAPLSFVYDAAISSGNSGGYRPLRFQDAVSIDGDPTWLIKSWKLLDTEQDGTQMAEYECIQPFPGQHFVGRDGREYRRRSARRLMQRASGMGTHGGMFGTQVASPAREGRHLQLPVVRQFFGTLQHNDGTFQYMAGSDPVGTTPL